MEHSRRKQEERDAWKNFPKDFAMSRVSAKRKSSVLVASTESSLEDTD